MAVAGTAAVGLGFRGKGMVGFVLRSLTNRVAINKMDIYRQKPDGCQAVAVMYRQAVE